jgi:hypothetical protein
MTEKLHRLKGYIPLLKPATWCCGPSASLPRARTNAAADDMERVSIGGPDTAARSKMRRGMRSSSIRCGNSIRMPMQIPTITTAVSTQYVQIV